MASQIRQKPLSYKELIQIKGKNSYVDFILLTGLRVAEVPRALAEWSKDKSKTYVDIKTKKSGDNTNRIYFSKEAIDTLHKMKGYSVRNIQRIVRSTGEKYINKSISPHNLRATFATNGLRMGRNIKEISVCMNHSDISQTAKYIRLDENSYINTVEAIALGYKFTGEVSETQRLIAQARYLNQALNEQKMKCFKLENDIKLAKSEINLLTNIQQLGDE